MQRLVTIYGGSGFVGRYVARRLAKAGWRVRVACRRPYEAHFVRMYGSVGQVEPVFCNIRDDASTAAAMMNADAVVNCVGILSEAGRNTFGAVQRGRGPSGSPASPPWRGLSEWSRSPPSAPTRRGGSDYARTKAEGEAAVMRHMPRAAIMRPSIVFGPEDKFFNRFAAMARRAPVLPVIGAGTRFQPVFVDDVAAAVAKAVEGEARPGIHELGGPDVDTFRELLQTMLRVIHRRALILPVPFFVGRAMGFGLDMVQRASFGILHNGILTRDQVRNLAHDNVVSGRYPGFAQLGIEPTSMEAVLPAYLWRFRPSGQYAQIKESARNLRT